MKSIIVALCVLLTSLWADSEDNNIAVGYQIGGNTLIGFDYEIRVTDVIGIHGGGGFLGAGGGIRLHFDDDCHAPYFDINYKDAGFGVMESIGFEMGGTWLVGGTSGFRGSFGIQKILMINDDFRDELFGDEDTPPIILALQVGWAW